MGELAAGAWLRATAHRSHKVRWLWHRLLKKPFFGRFDKPWRWPQDVPTQGWERVSFASASHATLQGLIKRTSAAQARGVVVCAHPMGLAAKGFWLRGGHAAKLLEAGWHVMAFDFNGFGESESTNFDWPADAIAAGRFARVQFPGVPVHALTASFGAMHTLNALPCGGFPFERVVAEGCAPSLPAFWKSYPVAHAVLSASRWMAPAVEKGLRPAEAIRTLPAHVRVLLIHSHADRWTPVAHGDAIAQGAPPLAQVTRLILTRAEHTQGLRDEPDTYWPAVRAFLEAD